MLSGRQYWGSVGCAPQTVAAQKWRLFLICKGLAFTLMLFWVPLHVSRGLMLSKAWILLAFPLSSPVLAGNRLTNVERIVKCPGRLC